MSSVMPDAPALPCLRGYEIDLVPLRAVRRPLRHGTQWETGMARALDAIRQCARIAWWDGSALGLHLNGLGGWFGLAEAAPRRQGGREEGL